MKQLVERYRTVIQWSDEDNAFIAEIPDLPGCIADGATRDDALQHLNEVAEMWIDRACELGWKIPGPERELVSA